MGSRTWRWRSVTSSRRARVRLGQSGGRDSGGDALASRRGIGERGPEMLRLVVEGGTGAVRSVAWVDWFRGGWVSRLRRAGKRAGWPVGRGEKWRHVSSAGYGLAWLGESLALSRHGQSFALWRQEMRSLPSRTVATYLD